MDDACTSNTHAVARQQVHAQPLCACTSRARRIIAEASSYATGKVRVECIVGLRRLGALACLKPGSCWARLVEDLQLYPRCVHVYVSVCVCFCTAVWCVRVCAYLCL